jgi:hypothetical protein
MNRRQALAAMGAGGGLALGGDAVARPDVPLLKVSVDFAELYGLDGKLALPPTLRNAGYGLRFVVVVENVSAGDVYVWAETNSEGYGSFSFEVTAGGKKSAVQRIDREWSKNILRLEKIVPGGVHTRVVEYDPPAGKAPQWEPFPFGAKDSQMEVTLRAVFEQKKAVWNGKLAPWSGRVVSPEYKVTLYNA